MNLTLQIPSSVYDEIGSIAKSTKKSRTNVILAAWDYYRLSKHDTKLDSLEQKVQVSTDRILEELKHITENVTDVNSSEDEEKTLNRLSISKLFRN